MNTNLLIQKGVELFKEANNTHDFTDYYQWLHGMSLVSTVHELDINMMIIEYVKREDD